MDSKTPKTDGLQDEWTPWNISPAIENVFKLAREIEDENTRLKNALSSIDRYLKGCEAYEHGVMEGSGDDNSLTPTKLMRSFLDDTTVSQPGQPITNTNNPSANP